MKKLTIIILSLTLLISCDRKNTKKFSSMKSKQVGRFDSTKNDGLNKENIIISPEIKMLSFLNSHFKQNQDTTFLKKPDWMIGDKESDTNCGYKISFKEGHTFKHEQECVEWGEIVTVKFKGFTSDSVRKIVENLFRDENYNWYSNNTEYRPKENFETVWTFKIQEEKESIILEFAYSWI